MTSLKRKAFTLVELVIVIAVISILAAVLIPTFSGIIRSANKSADEQILVSINLGLAMADKIENEDDLKKAINETFSEGTYEKLAPKSAQYGYYYWYDVETNTVVLKTYSEIEALHNERIAASASNAKKRGAVAMAATVAKNEGFKDSAKSNFRMFFENFFILDKGGSVVAEAFEALNTGAADLVEKVEALANIKTSSDNKELADALLDKLNKIALVSNDLTYVRNADLVESIYFVPGITTIPTFTSGEYIAKAENIKSAIIIPDTVTTVQENALIFDNSGVKLQTYYESAEEIAEVFQANSTNATILSAADLEYTIDGGSLVDPDGNKEDLAYGNPVESFEIVTPADTSDYKSVLNNIYVAYNYTGSIQLGVGSFVGVNAGAVSSEAVTWESDNEHVVVDENNGTFSINGLPELEECTATITATAVAGGATASVQVNIARPQNFEFNFATGVYDMTVDADHPVEQIIITFDGSVSSFAFTDFYEDCNIDEINCDTSFAVTAGAGSLFTITDNVLTFVDGVKFVDDAGNPITQQFTVKIGTALKKTFEVMVNDISAAEFDLNTPFKDPKFLYRVGNGNSVTLGHFFNGTTSAVPATLTIADFANTGLSAKVNGEVSANGTWSIDVSTEAWMNTTIEFIGTGVAEINLGGVSTKFEIVDGWNALSYSDFKSGSSIVMLKDIVMSDNSRFALSNATLYGNDFEFDVTKGNYTAVRYDGYSAISENYRIYLNNGILNNVRIVGNPFDGFSATDDNPNNICNVLVEGNSKILNSYISYCAAPVRMRGTNLEIINTTLHGGSIANLEIREGNVILDNVTTINQKSVNGSRDSEGAVGFGVIIWYERVPEKTSLTIKGTFSQYNYMSKSDFESISLVLNNIDLSSTVTSTIFNPSNGTGKFIYTDNNGTKWIHTGVFSMTNAFGSDNIKFPESNSNSIYSGSPVSASYSTMSFNGYLYSITTANVSLANPTGDYSTAGQGRTYPSYTFNNDKNTVNKGDGSTENEYCYKDGNNILISFDQGASKTFILTDFFSTSKNGLPLTITDICLDGESIFGQESVIFNTDKQGEHTLMFVYDDPYNYHSDGTAETIQNEASIIINVISVVPDAKSAEFTFGSDSVSSKTVTIGNKTYVMPDISATSDSFASTTISGTTIYMPIVSGFTSNESTSQISGIKWYMCFPVFSGVVTITDYEDGGKGNAVIYNGSTTQLPAGLSAIDPANKFEYATGSTAPETPTVYSNKLVYTSPEMEGVSRNSYTYDVEYVYKDNMGNIYNYFVRYITPKITNTGCVISDTLVTLADGTQKEIQYVTYEDKLLVWNFHKGEYDVIGASIVMNHGYDYYKIVTLNFADGTTVNTINGHGFFDVETNKYVVLNEENVAGYVGNEFVKVDDDGYSTTKLIGYSISEEYTESWSILTATHYNCILEGMWTLTPAEVEGSPDYLMPFEIKDMKYDEEAMKADIEKYGLYTYEEFADLITIEQFEALGLATFKVSVGKGYITYEDILFLIDLHC